MTQGKARRDCSTKTEMVEGKRLRRVDYRELNSKQKEIYNFQKVAARLADYGFNCIKAGR